jgi:hypothetical protein
MMISRLKSPTLRWQAMTLLMLLVLTSAVRPVRAEEGEHHEGRSARAAAQLPAYEQECGACHLAFPARYLPAESWQRVMGGLDKHFGVNASLDAAQSKTIGHWLQQNAASGWRASSAPPQDRITRSRWFVSQHDEVGAAVWKRKSVGSAANCVACHSGAAQGNFSEHGVRIPR